MKRSFLSLVLLVVTSASLAAGVVETVSPQTGRPVAPVTWTDETGRIHRLSEFAGYPVVLLPVYTRCRTACVTNVGQLKEALAAASTDPTQFRVLLFSFDHTDTPSVLTEYRSRQHIPLGWSTGTGSPADTDALLESIGYPIGQAGKEFTHPNMLVVLDSNLRVSKWIYGDSYSGRDIDTALAVAGGGNDWIGRHSDLLYSLLLFAASLCSVFFCYYVLQLMFLRRAPRAPAGNKL